MFWYVYFSETKNTLQHSPENCFFLVHERASPSATLCQPLLIPLLEEKEAKKCKGRNQGPEINQTPFNALVAKRLTQFTTPIIVINGVIAYKFCSYLMSSGLHTLSFQPSVQWLRTKSSLLHMKYATYIIGGCPVCSTFI